jgi:dihydroorotase
MKKLELTLPTPWDLHLHVRDGARLASVVPFTARQFGGAIIMPNLKPKHITTVTEVLAYRQAILNAVPEGLSFMPLMTVSLTKEMAPEDLRAALACEHVYAVKLYAGTTTNAAGIDNIESLFWAFGMIEKAGKCLLIHGEAGTTVDIFHRERQFYEDEMWKITSKFPHLKIVCEHITTAYAVAFVESQGPNVAATITPHHLLVDRNDMLGKGGIRVHMYCLPILKKREDREALMRAATSGSSKFFLGTDSAPHPQGEKESACGCAGAYNAPSAIELYATAFASVGKLHMLPDFASRFGCEFYGLPAIPGQVEIWSGEELTLPPYYDFGENNRVVPFQVPGLKINYKAVRVS